jgi:hypothetical protein
MNMIWTLKMGNKPFHEWYQEWSTYASCSNANDVIKMFAFHQALPAGLNDKLIGLSPTLMTLAGLVNKARLFDQQYQLWKWPGQGSGLSQCPCGPHIKGATTEDPSINLASTGEQSFQPKLIKEEHANHQKKNECFYCRRPGHFARECCKQPGGQQGDCPWYNPTRTCTTNTREDTPPPPPVTIIDEEDSAVIALLYQDPHYHFTVPNDPSNPTGDF